MAWPKAVFTMAVSLRLGSSTPPFLSPDTSLRKVRSRQKKRLGRKIRRGQEEGEGETINVYGAILLLLLRGVVKDARYERTK